VRDDVDADGNPLDPDLGIKGVTVSLVVRSQRQRRADPGEPVFAVTQDEQQRQLSIHGAGRQVRDRGDRSARLCQHGGPCAAEQQPDRVVVGPGGRSTDNWFLDAR